MRIDFRVKHDVETRRLAAELFADGLGRAAAAKRLSVPEAAVRKWQQIYRAFGSEVLLTMDGRQARYTYEQKVAAARAVVCVSSSLCRQFLHPDFDIICIFADCRLPTA